MGCKLVQGASPLLIISPNFIASKFFAQNDGPRLIWPGSEERRETKYRIQGKRLKVNRRKTKKAAQVICLRRQVGN